jgi:hypothetical protein
LLVVGDSAAAGVGAATQDEALSGQLAVALAPTFRLHWKLLAFTGCHHRPTCSIACAAKPPSASTWS